MTEIEITQRLLALIAGRAADELVSVRAGDVRALLEGLAALGCSSAATAPSKRGRWPRPPSSTWLKIEAYLQERPDGATIAEIAKAFGLLRPNVAASLKRHACEKVPGTFRWKLRARKPLTTGSTH